MIIAINVVAKVNRNPIITIPKKVRRELYAQCFDELIRQTTVSDIIAIIITIIIIVIIIFMRSEVQCPISFDVFRILSQ